MSIPGGGDTPDLSDGSGNGNSKGGCSMGDDGHGQAGSGLFLLGLLVAGLGLRRRRQSA